MFLQCILMFIHDKTCTIASMATWKYCKSSLLNHCHCKSSLLHSYEGCASDHRFIFILLFHNRCIKIIRAWNSHIRVNYCLCICTGSYIHRLAYVHIHMHIYNNGRYMPHWAAVCEIQIRWCEIHLPVNIMGIISCNDVLYSDIIVYICFNHTKYTDHTPKSTLVGIPSNLIINANHHIKW